MAAIRRAIKNKNIPPKRNIFVVPAFSLCLSRIGLTPHKHTITLASFYKKSSWRFGRMWITNFSTFVLEVVELDFLIRLAIIKPIKFYAVDQRKNKTLPGEAGRGEKTAGKRTFPRGKKESGSGGGLGSRSGRSECGNNGHRGIVRRF